MCARVGVCLDIGEPNIVGHLSETRKLTEGYTKVMSR